MIRSNLLQHRLRFSRCQISAIERSCSTWSVLHVAPDQSAALHPGPRRTPVGVWVDAFPRRFRLLGHISRCGNRSRDLSTSSTPRAGLRPHRGAGAETHNSPPVTNRANRVLMRDTGSAVSAPYNVPRLISTTSVIFHHTQPPRLQHLR